MRDGLLDELVRPVDVGQRLLQVDDVDAVALGEDVALHLRVPAAGLVPEVHAGVQQLPHGDDGHGRDSHLCRFGRTGSAGTRFGCHGRPGWPAVLVPDRRPDPRRDRRDRPGRRAPATTTGMCWHAKSPRSHGARVQCTRTARSAAPRRELSTRQVVVHRSAKCGGTTCPESGPWRHGHQLIPRLIPHHRRRIPHDLPHLRLRFPHHRLRLRASPFARLGAFLPGGLRAFLCHGRHAAAVASGAAGRLGARGHGVAGRPAEPRPGPASRAPDRRRSAPDQRGRARSRATPPRRGVDRRGAVPLAADPAASGLTAVPARRERPTVLGIGASTWAGSSASRCWRPAADWCCTPDRWPTGAWCRSSTPAACARRTSRCVRRCASASTSSAARSIGLLLAGHPGCPAVAPPVCLHWGVHRGRRLPGPAAPGRGRSRPAAAVGRCAVTGVGRVSCGSTSLVRSRSTARVCSWHTRDSVTPSTWPISARVRFSK